MYSATSVISIHKNTDYTTRTPCIYSHRGLLECDRVYCCGGIPMFWRTMLPPSSEWRPLEDLDMSPHLRENLKSRTVYLCIDSPEIHSVVLKHTFSTVQLNSFPYVTAMFLLR